MAERKSRINTSALFQTMVAAGDTRDIGKETSPEEGERRVAATEKKKSSEEKDRITIYLQKETNRKLSLQSSTKCKEKDRTAIVEAAVALLLDLNDDTYARLKATAEATGRSTGSIVEDALRKIL